MIKKSLIKSYAELIVKAGGAIQKGQEVVIRAQVELEDFVEVVARECYKQGASRVVYEWQSSKLSRLEAKYGKEKVCSVPTPMEVALQNYETDSLPVLIWLDGDDPDGLAGVNVEKLARIHQAKMRVLGPIRQKRENKYQWTIAGVPTVAWAKKVFPSLPKSQAVEALWNAILKASRAYDGNGIANWDEHEKNLKEKCAKLNALDLRKLHYTAGNGTDFTVGLIPGVIFLGGGEKTTSGILFQPNIPSEEAFTTPMKGEAEGVVYASKPLSYQGQLIENFSVRFEKGKAVEVHAEKGEEALRSILAVDDGSAYLGECALVPFESPINQLGFLFYNTLYDENAACHLALGRGFSNLYPDFEKYTNEELIEKGINYSTSHVDFMIGTRDLKIVGTKADGSEVTIFENGTWAL